MFKAMEMLYNYYFVSIGHGLAGWLLPNLKVKHYHDREFRRIAEGIAGGMPLLGWEYLLRDPDGETAGSEWYMLKDGKGNEFDARPFFPLTVFAVWRYHL